MHLSTNLNLSEYDLDTYLILKYVLKFLVNTGPVLGFLSFFLCPGSVKIKID